jgi:hypothetical protein
LTFIGHFAYSGDRSLTCDPELMPDEITQGTTTPETLEPVTPPSPTWESASEPSVAPVTDETSVPAVTEPAPAETATLETDTPLPADEAVRESEAKTEAEKDEDVQEDDTPEILSLPSGSSSRKWARKQYYEAKPVRDFLDLDKPIAAFGDELYKRSPSRYFDHVRDVFDLHGDSFAQQVLGVESVAKAKELLNGNALPQTPTDPQGLPKAEELDQLTNEQIVQRMVELQAKAKTEAETTLQSKLDDLQKQLDAVTGERTTERQQAAQTRAAEEGQKLHDKVWTTVVDGGIRDSGLEVKPDDLPEVARLKKAAQKILRDNTDVAFAGDGVTDESKLTDSQKENRKVIRKVQEFINRGEFHNATNEEDNLVLRGRAAFEEVKQWEEVQAILGQIEALAKPKVSRTGSPVVPGPGSSAGMTIKPPTTWDEAVSQAAH